MIVSFLFLLLLFSGCFVISQNLIDITGNQLIDEMIFIPFLVCGVFFPLQTGFFLFPSKIKKQQSMAFFYILHIVRDCINLYK